MDNNKGEFKYESSSLGLELIFDTDPNKSKTARIQELSVLEQYPGPLPNGLLFNDSSQTAIKKLGQPVNWGFDWIGYSGPIKASLTPLPLDQRSVLQIFTLDDKVRRLNYISRALNKGFYTIPQEYLVDPDNLLALLYTSMKEQPYTLFWGALDKFYPGSKKSEFHFDNKGVSFTLLPRTEYTEKGRVNVYDDLKVDSIILDPQYRGRLPDGLTFDDSLTTLEAKLGKSSYDSRVNEYIFYYGVAVSYQDNKIKYIRFNWPMSTRDQLNPTELAKGTFNNLPRYLGKSITDKAIWELMIAYGCGIRVDYNSSFEIRYHRYGLALQFDQNNILTQINLSGYSSYFNCYTGPLPGGLLIGDSKETVAKKLGAPLKVETTSFGVDATYQAGIRISYSGDKIDRISLLK
jgi:hypothetical protein